MATTQTDLDNLIAARNSGALRITYADSGGGTRIVEYRSISDLNRAIAAAQQELNAQSGTISNRQTRVYTDSGWGC